MRIQSDIVSPPSDGIRALLRRWRTERGLSQNVLAARAGISASTLSRWESGTTSPSIPEWEATLTALGLPTKHFHETLPLLAAPRAVRQLRKDTGSCAPPVGGDLLRAMRMRRGMTQAEVASHLGVPQNAIARWERSETWPDNECLHALCYHLKAFPEEVTALTVGRFSIANMLDLSDPAALHQEQWRIRVQPPHASDAVLKDLRFLALEARLHALLAASNTQGRGERIQRILSWTYSRHAQYLFESGRFAEAVAPAQHALALQKSLWPRNHEGWVPAVVALAANEARLSGRRKSASPKRALKLFEQYIGYATSPEYRAWMLTGMAQYILKTGRAEEAVRYSEDALRSVIENEGNGLRVERQLRRRDHASLLLAAGQAAKAVPFLPDEEWQNEPDHRVRDLLVRAEVFHALGDSEAQNALRQVFAILDTHATMPLSEGKTLHAGWQTTLRAKADLVAGSIL